MTDVQNYILIGVFAFLFALSEGLGLSPSESNSIVEIIIRMLKFYKELFSNKSMIEEL